MSLAKPSGQWSQRIQKRESLTASVDENKFLVYANLSGNWNSVRCERIKLQVTVLIEDSGATIKKEIKEKRNRDEVGRI